MEAFELRQHLFELTPIEQERLASGRELPSAFYRMLDSTGNGASEDGVYHLLFHTDAYESVPTAEADSVWGKLERSPLQDGMIIKKASRFYHEPIASCNAVCIRYVYAGSSQMRIQNEEVVLHAGDLCLLNSRALITQYLAHATDLVFTFIFDRESLIRDVLEPIGASNVVTRICMSHIMQTPEPESYVLFTARETNASKRLSRHSCASTSTLMNIAATWQICSCPRSSCRCSVAPMRSTTRLRVREPQTSRICFSS